MDTSTPRRIGISALAIAALGASFAAGATWDDDGTSRGRIVAAPERLPVVPQGPGTLVRVGGCAELLEWYVDNTVDQVTPWGWNGGWGYYDGGRRDGVLLSDSLAGSATAEGSAPFAAEDRAAEQSSSATGTNVQESGVDEPDVVKTNGELLVRIEGDDLTTYDVSGAKVRKLSTIDLPGTTDDSTELLLIGDEVVVLSQEAQRWDQQTMRTTVRRVDLGNPEEPEVLDDEQSYDAALISARQYGDTVRLVLGTGLPALDFVQPDDRRNEREALKENQRIVRESEIEDWLPSVRDGGGDSELAVGCESMSRPEDFAGGGSVVVVGYDAASPSERSSLGVATSSSIVYSSADRLYLATSPMWSTIDGDLGWGGRSTFASGGEDDGMTALHAFELDGTDATYLGSGEVEGAVRDRWAMDAVDGTLRVAVGATSQTGNFNSVVTLREKDGALEEIGRLDRLGVNEQIKSVRWFDDLAFVVTFRQTDPLYAIDLSDPARPRTLAALKIPGFSEYLHPIGDDLMIGIGQDASMTGMTRGGQAAVFDISDLTDLRRVDTHGYGRNRQTTAGADPRQFTWLPDRRTALTVVSEWGRNGGASGLVSVLEVGEDGELTNRMLPGTYGYDDVAHLRTVPLPDGRVVLATENDARFLTF